MRTLLRAESGKENNDEPPDEQPPFFHEADYVIRTWLEHRMHHTYPDDGGYNSQCSWLMRDWHILSMYYLRAEKGVYSHISMPTGGAEWQTQMGD